MMAGRAHPFLAIAVLEILEVVVLPLWPQPHTQQREPTLLGHGREVVSKACKRLNGTWRRRDTGVWEQRWRQTQKPSTYTEQGHGTHKKHAQRNRENPQRPSTDPETAGLALYTGTRKATLNR